jgi:ArsR family transcriptional regulator
MREFVKVMKALSDPNRVKILKMLERKSICVCELECALGLAQPTVSKHLRVLEEAGLASYQKDGLWVNYMLADGKRNDYAKMMIGNLKGWLNEDSEVRRLVEKLPEIDRQKICRK